jgi:hypothetical protein
MTEGAGGNVRVAGPPASNYSDRGRVRGATTDESHF